MKIPDIIIGEKFNNLTVLKKTNKKLGTSYLWECKCDCGKLTLSRIADLKNGHKKSCGCAQRSQIRELGKSKKKNLSNQKFGKLTVIKESDDRKDGRVCWHCICDCGNNIIVSSHDLLGDRVKSCGCLQNLSAGEEKIIKLLEENNLVYEKEKTFNDLTGIDGHYLRFDFFVQNSYIIEFDGRQHFIYEANGYGKDLKEIQYRDNIKNQYCFNNNIPIIRIPYTAYSNLCLDDLLVNKSIYLLKEK